MMNPTPSVIGNPIPKILSCGAARVRMPSARLVISRAATIGSAICMPALNIFPPQFVIVRKFCVPIGADDIGSVVKLSARAERRAKCIFVVKNVMIINSARN